MSIDHIVDNILIRYIRYSNMPPYGTNRIVWPFLPRNIRQILHIADSNETGYRYFG